MAKHELWYSKLFFYFELILNLPHLIIAVVVVRFARHEKPELRILVWIVGFIFLCFAGICIFYLRFRHYLYRCPKQEPHLYMHTQQAAENHTDDEENQQAPENQHAVSWLNRHIQLFKIKCVWNLCYTLWCFFSGLMLVPYPAPYPAPVLDSVRWCYKEMMYVFYAFGFSVLTLCATPEFTEYSKPATSESVIALPLPTYTFKANQNSDIESEANNLGGTFAAGTVKERVLSGEDAVCCICLCEYADNEELKELLCDHLFHAECIDKWQRVKALCPLCERNIGRD